MTFPRLQVRFSSSRFHLLCVFALLSWLGCQSFLPASAQTTATIEGTVSDVQGAVVPKAKVYIENIQLGLHRTAFTDNAGRYLVSGLPPGSYDVSFEAEGFANKKIENLAAVMKFEPS